MKPEVIAQIAQVAHEVNKAYCEFLGDKSQVTWEETPEAIKASALDGVVFHLSNPEVTPAESHANWKKFKKEEGWVYGETKDSDLKTHPCMVAYSKLPEDQRIKDVLFKQVVLSLSNLGDMGNLGNLEAPQDLREVLEGIARLESTMKGALSQLSPVKPKVKPKVYPSRSRVVKRPQVSKGGFAQPTDVVRKAAVTNTNEGSGGSLNMPARQEAPATPVAPQVTPKRKGGLITSGAGDGATALAMMEQTP